MADDIISEQDVEAHRCAWPDITDELWDDIKRATVGQVVWDDDYTKGSLVERKEYTMHKMIDFY